MKYGKLKTMNERKIIKLPNYDNEVLLDGYAEISDETVANLGEQACGCMESRRQEVEGQTQLFKEVKRMLGYDEDGV